MPSLTQPPSSNKLSQLPLQQLWEVLAPVTASPRSARASFTNWGLTYTCRPLSVFEPENEAECGLVLELARREGKKVRVAGVGHSPSDLACTSEYMLRTEKLDKVLEVSWLFRPASLSRVGPRPRSRARNFWRGRAISASSGDLRGPSRSIGGWCHSIEPQALAVLKSEPL